MQDVAGKVAFITGGTSGIGRGIALAFARAGMRVVAAGRRPGHLEEAAAFFAAAGLDVATVQLDVTDAAAVEQAAAGTEQRYGAVHVLVNNAGIGIIGPVAGARPDDWDWIIDVNIKGVAHGLASFLPRIRARGEGGHIVNTASMGGLLPVSAGLYCLTKAGIIALSETLHIELAPENIGVSAYIPGPVHSSLGSSSAARPGKYADTGYPARPPRPRDPAAAPPPFMTAEEAGERVLAGVRRNDLFILTHPEFRDGVAERSQALLNAFPDEPIDAERAAAITFLTSHEVYRAAAAKPPPRPLCRP